MGSGAAIPVPFPLSSFPGANPQEAAGRLINCYAEPLGEAQKPTGPAQQVWRRSPGLSIFAATAEAGGTYRGGLISNNLSYEIWANVYTLTREGVATLLGALPGTKKVSIAHNQVRPTPDVVAVDIDNGAYILNTTALANATATATIAGTTFVSGDTVTLRFNNPAVINFPVAVTYTIGSSETATTIATGLNNLINANAILAAANLTAISAAGVITISQQGLIGNGTTVSASVAAIGSSTAMTGTATGTGNETVTIAPGSGSATATIAGTVFTSGDTVSLTFANPLVAAFPVKITYTLGAGESATTIATGLKNLINASAALLAAGITATSALGVVTVNHPVGNETVTFAPTTGTL